MALIIAILFFTMGFIGTMLPLLPGAPLILAGMLVYGFLTDFTLLDWQFFMLQGLIVLVVVLIDYVAGAWGAERFGGSRASVTGSIIGGLAGVVFLGPAGIIAGPFLGASAAELLAGRSPKEALKAGWGTVIGFVGGTLLKFLQEVIMVIWFFLRVLGKPW